MKKILFLITLLSIYGFVYGQKIEKTDLLKAGLKGNVKIIKDYYKKGLNNQELSVADNEPNYYAIYNSEGYIMAEAWKNEGSRIFKYNKGKLVEISNYNSKIICKYDEKGNNIEREEYNKDGFVIEKGEMFYDNRGNMIEVKFYYANYNIKEKKYSDLESKGRIEFKYDKMDRVIQENSYENNDKLIGKKVTTYNIKGDIEKIEFYDEKGNMFKKGELIYDELGNLIKERDSKFLEGKNLMNEYEFIRTYDKIGNWVKEVGYKDNKVFREITREIEYY